MIDRQNKDLLFLTEGVMIDTFMLYSFLSRLVTPFEKTKAFKLGIIDKTGKILKTRKQLKTSEEKNAFTTFDLLVWNLKKLLSKVPFGKTVLASYVAALWLIKEQKNSLMQDQVMLYESFSDYLDMINRDPKLKKVIEDLMTEEGEVTNSAGGNAIAGLGTDDTVVVKRKSKMLKRQNENWKI